MKQENKVWLFITRCQPGLHTGHVDAIKQAVEQWITDLVIGVWSSNKEFTSENPFTYHEREHMIQCCKDQLLDIGKITIKSIPDFGDNEKWLNYITTQFPHFDCVITGNVRVQEIFQKTDKIVIPLEIRNFVKSSIIRNQLALGNYHELEKSLSKPVLEYLEKINAFTRIKELMEHEFQTPKLSVDMVFFDKEGNIILVERKNEPLGKALPGGFVEYGEEPKDAAIRETQEETWASTKVKNLIGVWGDPSRDPRGHVVTIAYQGEYIEGEIKANDDAKDIVRVKPENLHQIDFAFPDHKEIIDECLKKFPHRNSRI